LPKGDLICSQFLRRAFPFWFCQSHFLRIHQDVLPICSLLSFFAILILFLILNILLLGQLHVQVHILICSTDGLFNSVLQLIYQTSQQSLMVGNCLNIICLNIIGYPHNQTDCMTLCKYYLSAKICYVESDQMFFMFIY